MRSRKNFWRLMVAAAIGWALFFSTASVCAAMEEELYNYKIDMSSDNLFSMTYGYSGGTKYGQPNLSKAYVSGKYGNALQITYYGYKIANPGERYNAYVMQFSSSKITVGEQEMDFVEYLKHVHTISFWVKTPKLVQHSENMRDSRVIEMIFETENMAGTGKYNKRIELPNTGEWAYISVPINDFNGFGDAIQADTVKQLKQMSISFPYNDYFGCQPDDSTLEEPWAEPLVIDEMLFDCYSAEYPAFTPPSVGEESYHTNANVKGISVEGNPVYGFQPSASANEVPIPRSYTIEDLKTQVFPILAAPPIEPDETHQRTSGASYVLEIPDTVPGQGRLTVTSADKSNTRTCELNFVWRDGLQILTGTAQGIDFSAPLTAGEKNIMFRAVNESAEQSCTVQALAVVRDNQSGEVYSAASTALLDIEPEGRKWMMLSLTVPEERDCSLSIYFVDGMEQMYTVWQAVSTGADSAGKQTETQAVLCGIMAEVDEKEHRIKISGEAEKVGVGEQALIVLNDSEGNLANVYAVGLDEDGFQSGFLYDADRMSGRHTLFVGVGGKVLTQEIYLPSADESVNVLQEFRNLSGQSSDAELKSFYDNFYESLSVPNELKDKLSTQEKILVMKDVLRENPQTFEALRTFLREYSLLYVFNRAEDGEKIYALFRAYRDIFQFESDRAYITKYLTEPSAWSAVLGELQGKDFAAMADVRKGFFEASLVYAFQHMKVPNESKALLEDNSVCLRDYMDYSAYEKLAAEGKQAGYYQWIFEKEIKRLSDLDMILQQYKKTLTKPSGGSSGGSGSSGGGGGAVNNVFAVKTDNEGTEPSVPQPTPIEKPKKFYDLSTVPWAEEAINALAELGIVSGKEEHLFVPNDHVTREEFVKLLVSALRLESEAAGEKFNDVGQEMWYSEPLRIASALGVVNGVSEQIFGIGESITRQDIAVMAMRTLTAGGVQLPDSDSRQFADDSEIADYADEAVYRLSAAGIISGTDENCFAPRQSATRAEAAKIIYGIYKYSERISANGGEAV